jgi:hypothetical protein
MRRIKKTYLLVNPATQRTYNICLDYCRSQSKRPMTQIEIEYVGTLQPFPRRRPSASKRAVEKAIIADMLSIRDRLIRRHGFKNTTTTKRDWVRKKGAA